MANTKRCKQINGVHGGVLRKRLGDDQQSLGKLRDGPLLVGVEGPGVVLQMEAQRGLHSAAPWHHGVGLERPRDRAERVVHRALGLREHELVGAAEEDRGGLRLLAALDEDEVVVAYPLLDHLVGAAEVGRVEALVPVHVGHGEQHLRAGALGDALDVLLVHAAGGEDAVLHKVLHGKVVDALCGEEHVGPGLADRLDLVLRDVHLLLAHPLQLVRVVDDDVDVHRHLVLLQVEVDARDLGAASQAAADLGHHLLRAAGHLDRVAVGDQDRLVGALPVRLEDVDLAHGVLRLAVGVRDLHRLDRLDDDLREDVPLAPDKLGGEGGLRNLREHVLVQLVHLDAQVALDVLQGLLHRDAVPGDDRRRVDVVLDQLVRALQQLRRDDHHRGGAVADLRVLQVCQLHQNLGGGVLHLELLQDGGAVVGDRDVADVVHEHLVQALRTQRRLQDIGESHDGRHILRSDISSARTISVEGQTQLRCQSHNWATTHGRR
mmetsp:Transcript_61312/g.161124  ORF Transcript_61312/g.161124 Transcript_61312/m.161124 type:complete len:491 (-) Transcript_61312:36-1508(-)